MTFPMGTRVVYRSLRDHDSYGIVTSLKQIRRHCDVKGIPMIVKEGCFLTNVPTCHVMTTRGAFIRFAAKDLEPCSDEEWQLMEVMEV